MGIPWPRRVAARHGIYPARPCLVSCGGGEGGFSWEEQGKRRRGGRSLAAAVLQGNLVCCLVGCWASIGGVVEGRNQQPVPPCHLAPCSRGVGIVANVPVDINNLNLLNRSLAPTRGTTTKDSGLVQAPFFRPLPTAFARGAPPFNRTGRQWTRAVRAGSRRGRGRRGSAAWSSSGTGSSRESSASTS